MEIYGSSNFGIDLKDDQSPVTLADKAAHSVILNILGGTGLPILSEEGSNILYAQRKTWEYFWMVDPLDGTKEFIKRNGEFTVNIALIGMNVPVAGIIYAPCNQVLYYGSKETGVHKTENNVQTELLPVANRMRLEELQQRERVTVVASKSHLNEATSTFINQLPNPTLTSMGSSFKLMMLAEGKADVYPRMAPTMEWDTAAGHAILRALNKGVYQTDLQTELFYNKESLLNPSFIAL